MAEFLFPPGEVIFSPGDPSTHAYLIQEGSVEILSGAIDNPLRVALLGPNAVFGEMGLIEERPHQSTARAVTDVRATKMTREEFERGLLTDPASCRHYLRSLFERLRTLTARLGGDTEELPASPAPAAAPAPTTKPAAAARDTRMVPVARRQAQITLYPLSRKAAQSLPAEGLPLPSLPFRIGRAPEANEGQPLDLNDLWLLDQQPFSVSRNHLVIEQVGADRYLIRDRGSKAGAYVNDQWIGGTSKAWYADLEEGDNVLTVGSRLSPYQFRVTLVKSP